MAFTPTKSQIGSLTRESSVRSMISAGSCDKLSPSDDTERSRILGFNVQDATALEQAIFASVNAGDRERLETIFDFFPSQTTILQVLLTTSYPNREGFYKHDEEILQDAHELLGESLEHLNVMHIACLLGEEDIALDILEFVNRVTEEIEARKILYEFLGRIWGNGNTVLHLASFCGMSDLVKRLLELGAAHVKPNDRRYRPVDCADDDITRKMFEQVHEIAKKLPEPEVSTSLTITGHHVEDALIPVSATLHASIANSQIRESEDVRLPDNERQKYQLSSAPNHDKPISTSSLLQSLPASLEIEEKKKVQFDRTTILMDLCTTKEPSDNDPHLFRETLGLHISRIPGIDVNTIFSPQQHMTLLQLACSHGKKEIANILLNEAGSRVNDHDREGWTALHCASAEGHIEILRILGKCQGRQEGITSDKKADESIIYVPDGPIILNPRNDDGETPEEVALDSEADEIKLIFRGLREQYPQSVLELLDDPLDIEENEDSESEEDDIIVPRLNAKSRGSNMEKFLSRAPSIMKSTGRERHAK